MCDKIKRMIGFSCNLCLLRRTCKAGRNFLTFTRYFQNEPWTYFGKAAARSLHRPPTRPHPHQFRASFHHTVNSRLPTVGRCWKIFTRQVLMTASYLPSHSALTCSSVLGTQGLAVCCSRQLIIPPGNQDNRYEKVAWCDGVSFQCCTFIQPISKEHVSIYCVFICFASNTP